MNIILKIGNAYSLYAERVMVLVALFCRPFSLQGYLLYEFHHNAIPYNKYGWIKV